VPLCAGAYVAGAAGSNACPAGSVRIETEAACRTAATAAGMTFGSTSVEADYPRGCYIWTDDNKAYFNSGAVGAGAPDARLLCAAVATTGAPPRALCGSAGHTGERRMGCGTMHRQAHGVLCGVLCGARGQRVGRSCAPRGCGADVSRTGGQCIAPRRALAVCGRGTSWGTPRGML
jgi:hypothetical protein